MSDIEGSVNVLVKNNDLKYYLTYSQFYWWVFCAYNIDN